MAISWHQTKMEKDQPHLLVFGPGFTAKPIMQQLKSAGWQISASYRRLEAREAILAEGYQPFDITAHADGLKPSDLGHVSYILTSIAPKDEGDPALDYVKRAKADFKSLKWIGYLSSTNVYGDHEGRWVSEITPPNPSLKRGILRLAAEDNWRKVADDMGAALHTFRLAGIYGPGRNAIKTMLQGRAKRVIKPGQVFSRIHVADICQTVVAAAQSGLGHEIFNLADDVPAPPQDVITHAATLLDMMPPPETDWQTAEMSPMARSFYQESKRVRNEKIKDMLGINLKYPDYQSGLKAHLREEMTNHEASKTG